VLTDDERTAPRRDAEEDGRRAEVAVGDPQVAGSDHGQELVGHRPLLGVTVLAQDDIEDQPRLGLEDDQSLPRQGPGTGGPQRLEPMLGPGQVTAIDDPGAIPRQPGRTAALHGRHDRSQGTGGVTDQRGTNAEFHPVDLLVDRLACDSQRFGVLLVGGVDRGPDAADDRAHEVDDVGEEEVPGVLTFGHALEESIHGAGRQRVLEQGLSHDRDWGILDEPLEDFTEDHGCRLRGNAITSWGTTVYQNV